MIYKRKSHQKNCPLGRLLNALFFCTFYWSVNVFSTKVLTGDTIFTSPTGDWTAILRGRPSHAKVSPLVVQRKYLHFSVILRPWVMVRSRESNPRPPALQSNALPTELILPLVRITFVLHTIIWIMKTSDASYSSDTGCIFQRLDNFPRLPAIT